MNLQFLGDALDHWKGSVFEILQKSGQLVNFRVDAMASDAEDWGPSDWNLFSSLLRVRPDQIIPHRNSLKGSRANYFQEISESCDLFLDPDTGVQTGAVNNPWQYLRPIELVALLDKNPKHVVAVYQHVRAQATRVRVQQVLTSIKIINQGFFCTSYESGTVALLFISFDRSRVKSINNCFGALLGKHADRRVGLWE